MFRQKAVFTLLSTAVRVAANNEPDFGNIFTNCIEDIASFRQWQFCFVGQQLNNREVFGLASDVIFDESVSQDNTGMIVVRQQNAFVMVCQMIFGNLKIDFDGDHLGCLIRRR